MYESNIDVIFCDDSMMVGYKPLPPLTAQEEQEKKSAIEKLYKKFFDGKEQYKNEDSKSC